MKRGQKELAKRWCLWCYLASLLWMIGALLLSAYLEIRLAGVLLMIPGCAVGLYGWGLLGELNELPGEKRPRYCRFLNYWRIRDLPVWYIFCAVIWILM